MFLLLLIPTCADRTVYLSPKASFENWKSITGVIFLIKLIIGFILRGKIGAKVSWQNLGVAIGLQ